MDTGARKPYLTDLTKDESGHSRTPFAPLRGPSPAWSKTYRGFARSREYHPLPPTDRLPVDPFAP